MEKLYSIYYYNIQQNICERKETKEKNPNPKKITKNIKKKLEKTKPTILNYQLSI